MPAIITVGKVTARFASREATATPMDTHRTYQTPLLVCMLMSVALIDWFLSMIRMSFGRRPTGTPTSEQDKRGA